MECDVPMLGIARIRFWEYTWPKRLSSTQVKSMMSKSPTDKQLYIRLRVCRRELGLLQL